MANIKNQLVVNLFEKLKRDKISVPRLSEIIGIPKDRIYKWKQEGTNPKAEDEGLIKKWLYGESVENVPLATVSPSNDLQKSTIYHLAEGNRIQSETNHTVALTNQRLVEQNIALTQAYTGNADHQTIDETVLLVKALKDYLIEAVSELKKVPPQEVIQALYNKVNEVKDSRGKKDRQPEAGSKSSMSR